jgi:hypothetical protein
MTVLKLLLAGLLTACGLVAITPATSYACSCALGTTAAHVDWSDAIFVGTLTDRVPPPERRIMSSTDPVGYTFAVERVLKGDVDSTVEVESAMSSASCGWEGMELGGEYVVFASDDHGVLESGLCSGSRRSSPRFLAEVVGVTGRGLPPALDIGSLLAPFLVMFGFLP